MKYFFQQKIFELELFTKNKAFHSKLKHRKKFHFLGTMHSLPQRLKLTFLKKNSSGRCPKETWSEEKMLKNIELNL